MKKLLLLCMLFGVSGCLSNGAKKVVTKKTQNTAGVFAPTGDKPVSFYLSGLQVSATDPTADFEIFGQQDDFLSKYCVGTNDESTCRCEFSGEGFEVQSAPSYVESNMIRCSYTVIPPNMMTTTEVRVYVTTTQSYSNALVYNFGTGGTDALYPNLSTTYTPVIRYQCRDIIHIPYLFDSGGDPNLSVYDPIQSESSLLSYPLDFYTSNPGKTILGLARESGKNTEYSKWECHFNPYHRPFWLARRVYSMGSLYSIGSFDVYGNTKDSPLHTYTNTANLLAPYVITAEMNGFAFSPLWELAPALWDGTSAQFNRMDFLLAKKRTGVFNVPVNGLTAPGVLTKSPDSSGQQPPGTTPPLGWAAKAIPDGDGERCPTSEQVTIPADHFWVKLFLFKAPLDERYYVSATETTARLGSIACNWGNYSAAGAWDPVFPECAINDTALLQGIANASPADWVNYAPGATTAAGGYTGGQTQPVQDLPQSAAHRIATEYSLYWVDQTDPVNHLANRVSLGSGFGGSNPDACFRFSRDLSGFAYINGGKAGSTSGAVYDMWRMINKNGAMDSDTSFNFDAANVPVALEENLVDGKFTLSKVEDSNPFSFYGDGGTRVDYLFVVTPESIHLSDLQDGGTPAGKAFIPYRYKQDVNCTTMGNPDSDCANTDNFKITYEVWTKEAQGYDGANDTEVYPLCVLQKRNWK